jgi:hypothetical protein
MTLRALPMTRTTLLASADACAVRCAVFASQVDDQATRLSLLSVAGKYAGRGLHLRSLGVLR